MTDAPTILTGIKPSGAPHIGNYAGMFRPTLDMVAENPNGKNYLFVANYHALNTIKDPKELQQFTYEVAACFMALGLDPSNTFLYRQTDVPEVFELNTVLASVTPKGLMNRAHAYKASVDANAEKQSADPDDGVNVGLFTYPVLMAADILLFHANYVPVGKDQIQHVEFARDIAGYFNRKYDTDFLTLPEHRVSKDVEALIGLDGRKMSKSYGNTLPLFGDPKKTRKLINKIVTDSKLPEEPKDPDTSTIFSLYRALATKEETAALRKRFEDGGLGHGDSKKILADKVDALFADAAQRYQEFMSDRGELENIMQNAARGVRAEASAFIDEMRSIIGT